MAENLPTKEEKIFRTGIQCLGSYERSVCPVVFDKPATQLAKPTGEEMRALLKIREIKGRVAALNGAKCPAGTNKEKADWSRRAWLIFREELNAAGLYRHTKNDPEKDLPGDALPVPETKEATVPMVDGLSADDKQALDDFNAMPDAAPAPMTLEEARKRLEERRAQGMEAMRQDAETSGGTSLSAGQEKELPEEHGALYVPDVSQFTGREYFATEPEPYDWLLTDSFARGQLGAFIGPPGAGKGTLSIQLCVAAAAGVSWFGLGSWHIPRPCKALFVSAEDDQKTIHRRIRYALQRLPEKIRERALDNIVGVPVCGNVSLCENTAAGFHKNNVNVGDLDALLSTVKPELLVLDTLSRFFAIPENANDLMTQACGVLEEVCRKRGVTPIVIHHAGKGHGSDLVSNDGELATALSQHAARGATALAGAVRWMFNVAPLQKDFAATIFGENATDYTSGHYLAVKVSKKNIGAPESEKYLERGDDGICSLVEPKKKLSLEEQEKGYLERLIEEVARRAEKGEPPLCKSNGASFALNVGRPKGDKITARAIYEGKLVAVKKGKGNGVVLALPSDAENGEQEA